MSKWSDCMISNAGRLELATEEISILKRKISELNDEIDSLKQMAQIQVTPEMLADVERLRSLISDKDFASIGVLGNGQLEVSLHFQKWEGCSGWQLARRGLRLLWFVFRGRRGMWVKK
jgi:hypothetical protein